MQKTIKSNPTKFELKPASSHEAGFFYVQRQNQVQEQKPLVGRASFASGEHLEFTDAEAYLQCIREELPYRQTTGFRYETLTDDPVVRKEADDILYDLYGEENPRPLKDYDNTPQQGLTMGGM
ncbi:hypothetical protein [uncultured Dysosmobacter sp.]|uniref:hypothetical protein n=1 Tax=uncultured Dysosmobacter sp. TaxID=2591384 RepID=UPI00262C347B|nr:hypothetical protein [uncultured Dysosmobacter sp.]